MRHTTTYLQRALTVALASAFVVLPVVLLGPVAHADASSGDATFQGSTIQSVSAHSQPSLIYKKFPTDEPVLPGATWEIGVGVLLEGVTETVEGTVQLADPEQADDIELMDSIATFGLQNGLHNNYTLVERFELRYTGSDSPFLGPVGLALEIDNFEPILIQVDLSVIDQPGFPQEFDTLLSTPPATGNVTGDGNLEIVVAGTLNSQFGLYVLDKEGVILPGWPFRIADPDVVSQSFTAPTIVDLDQNGLGEILSVNLVTRDVALGFTSTGLETTKTLVALDGLGRLFWQVEGDFDGMGAAAVGDLDGDQELEIILSEGGNLMRVSANGQVFGAWEVETPGEVIVGVPVIADVDASAANGLEIVGCATVFSPTPSAHVYIWNEDGSIHSPDWPKEIERCHPPTVADIDGDQGNGLEVLLALDHGIEGKPDPKSGQVNSFSVWAWHEDGSLLEGWPYHHFRDPDIGLVDDRIIAPCSAADADGDGDLEILVAAYGQGDAVNGNLFMLHHDGTLDRQWPRWAGIAQMPSHRGGLALADLDGAGLQEIVTGSFRGVHVFHPAGEAMRGFPKYTFDNFLQPAVSDIDQDGMIEIVAAPLFDRLYVWKLLASATESQPWPQFRQNVMRTGASPSDQGAGIPAISEIALAVMICLVILAGGIVFRGGNTRSSR